MSGWLDPVREVLDRLDDAGQRVVFFRDDDVGWDDRSLLAMVDVFARRCVPIDLAVIPTAAHPRLADTLLRMRRDTRIGLHQHGYAHVNHEMHGRKCEFGTSRTSEQLSVDVSDGSRFLGMLFGEHLDPIFTPPWNRCGDELAGTLVDAGFEVLSRDSTAIPLDHPALTELPVTLDWSGRTKATKRPWDRAQRGCAIAEALRADEPMGVMLHHAVCDERDRADVDELLALLATDARVVCRSMVEVARA